MTMLNWYKGMIAILLIFLGCVNTGVSDKTGSSTDSSIGRIVANTTDTGSCSHLANFPESLSQMHQNPKVILDGKDSCLFPLIDSIASRYAFDGSIEYLQTLDTICSVSDGYVADYLSSAVSTVYMARPLEVIRYLYAVKGEEKAGLRQHLIYLMRDMIYHADESGKHYADSLANATVPLLTPGEKGYFSAMRSEWEQENK